MSPTVHNSILDVVKDCDSFIHPDDNPALYTATLQNNYYAFSVCAHPNVILGYIPKSIIPQIAWSPPDNWIINHTTQTVTLTLTAPATSPSSYSAILAQTLANTSPSTLPILRGWRNETFSVYAPQSQDSNTTTTTTPILEIERCASALFGIVTYGVQLIAYARTPQEQDNSLKLWIARRSKHKQTYPGMLDCTAAGGLPTGTSPLEGMAAEAVEEASLSPGLIRERMVETGYVSYFQMREEMGLLQPEVEYTFEIELSTPPSLPNSSWTGRETHGEGEREGEGVVPIPADQEVEAFMLLGVEEVLGALRRGEFKPNSAVVVVDFLIRHGVVTPVTEGVEEFGEIGRRLRRRLEREFPVRQSDS